MKTRRGLPGYGPWLIEQHCPAVFHNSLSGARGRYGNPPCICPHARALLTTHEAYVPPERKYLKQYLRTELDTPMPDLRAGACASPRYQQVARNAQTEATYIWADKARGEAKKVCMAACSVQLICRDYILAAEVPAGSWGSVWGGLSPEERKAIIRAQH